LLLEAFDHHLSIAAPSISNLPVSVSVIVESSGVNVGTIIIQPTDTIKEVRAAVIARLGKEVNLLFQKCEIILN
jgi:hypothetical protein